MERQFLILSLFILFGLLGCQSNPAVIKNIDDYLLKPLGEGLFRFNMQFDFDPEIRGDLEVKARGTESLMANEVRSQRLMQFLQTASNPALAPFAKFNFIIRFKTYFFKNHVN